ncbi:hypothetical protein COCNU_07G015420 [Cocos nucifera]|uniref:Uncharacterized protein n=1 Tax=Cocos nucifera TaxID=13894 RepID=A0A8K0N558_COCNU|nr:hypothetical protein COCNU_07G015420 [Cocos nucifera]
MSHFVALFANTIRNVHDEVTIVQKKRKEVEATTVEAKNAAVEARSMVQAVESKVKHLKEVVTKMEKDLASEKKKRVVAQAKVVEPKKEMEEKIVEIRMSHFVALFANTIRNVHDEVTIVQKKRKEVEATTVEAKNAAVEARSMVQAVESKVKHLKEVVTKMEKDLASEKKKRVVAQAKVVEPKKEMEEKIVEVDEVANLQHWSNEERTIPNRMRQAPGTQGLSIDHDGSELTLVRNVVVSLFETLNKDRVELTRLCIDLALSKGASKESKAELT